MSHIHNEEMPITAKEVKEEEQKRVQCQHCDKDFKTEMILRTHVKVFSHRNTRLCYLLSTVITNFWL